jgi:hypothetical protein
MKNVLIVATAAVVSAQLQLAAPRPVQAQAQVPIDETLQKPLPPLQPAEAQPEIPQEAPFLPFGLVDSTVVKLRLKQSISSRTAKVNDPLEFEVLEDIKIDNRVVIARGATARGVVTLVRRPGIFGRNGKLNISVKDVDLVTGERVTLRASQEAGGDDGSTGLMVVAAIFNPMVIFSRGSNVVYRAGTEVTSYVEGNFELDPSQFERREFLAPR